MAGSIEGPGRVLDPIRVDLCVPSGPWSHLCCIECKKIANNYFYLGQAIKSGKYGGTRALKGPAMVLSWSKLVNFFLDLGTTDKLEFTAWSEVDPTFGSRAIIIWKMGGLILPPPSLIRVNGREVFLNLWARGKSQFGAVSLLVYHFCHSHQ